MACTRFFALVALAAWPHGRPVGWQATAFAPVCGAAPRPPSVRVGPRAVGCLALGQDISFLPSKVQVYVQHTHIGKGQLASTHEIRHERARGLSVGRPAQLTARGWHG